MHEVVMDLPNTGGAVARRSYAAPQLTIYGSLVELTATGSAGPNEAANRLCSDVVPDQAVQANCMAG